MDNLSTVDKLAGPNVSFIKRIHCIYNVCMCARMQCVCVLVCSVYLCSYAVCMSACMQCVSQYKDHLRQQSCEVKGSREQHVSCAHSVQLGSRVQMSHCTDVFPCTDVPMYRYIQ